MTKDDDNLLTQTGIMLRRLWYSRPGYESIGGVLDVIDALFVNKNGQRPVIAHKHRTPHGWHLVLSLPAHVGPSDITGKLEYFETQAGARIDLKPNGKLLHMDIRTAAMPDRLPYSWQPENYPKMPLPLPIGHDGTQLIVIDLPKLPHLFVAGNTGGGKTTFLRTSTVSLVTTGALLAVIDLKGLDFHHLHKSGHAMVVDTERDALAMLQALNREMDRRKEILKAADCVKLQEYQGGDLPWIVCLIDELAELQEKAAQEALNRLARLSRAMGICIIVATQRPSHTLFSRFTDTRMLFAGKLCFSMPKPEDSRLILDSDAAAHLPPDIPGRGIWKWDRELQVQCMDLGVREAKKILAEIPPAKGGIGFERRAERLLPR